MALIFALEVLGWPVRKRSVNPLCQPYDRIPEKRTWTLEEKAANWCRENGVARKGIPVQASPQTLRDNGDADPSQPTSLDDAPSGLQTLTGQPFLRQDAHSETV